MRYDIISTGSKGNAVIVNDTTLIDCGVPFKALAARFRDLRIVLLTHIHQDHFNKATIRTLARERPTLRFASPEWLVSELIDCGVGKADIDVCSADTISRYGDGLSLMMFPLTHNVPNCGWRIFMGTYRFIYATDTNSLNGIVAPDYDLYLIEANYAESEIKDRIARKQADGEYCHEWDVLHNHLSKEKADDWLYKNMGDNSRYVYLHGHEEDGRDRAEGGKNPR